MTSSPHGRVHLCAFDGLRTDSLRLRLSAPINAHYLDVRDIGLGELLRVLSLQLASAIVSVHCTSNPNHFTSGSSWDAFAFVHRHYSRNFLFVVLLQLTFTRQVRMPPFHMSSGVVPQTGTPDVMVFGSTVSASCKCRCRQR